MQPTVSYRCELRLRLIVDAPARTDLCVVVRHADLPFVPVPGIRLTFDAAGDFDCGDFRIADVLYHEPRGIFFVELEDVRCTGDGHELPGVFATYVASGWRLKPEAVYDTREGAERHVRFHSERGFRHFLEESEGRFFSLTSDEADLFELQCRIAPVGGQTIQFNC